MLKQKKSWSGSTSVFTGGEREGQDSPWTRNKFLKRQVFLSLISLVQLLPHWANDHSWWWLRKSWCMQDKFPLPVAGTSQPWGVLGSTAGVWWCEGQPPSALALQGAQNSFPQQRAVTWVWNIPLAPQSAWFGPAGRAEGLLRRWMASYLLPGCFFLLSLA